jgi:hypothetical protein
MDVQVQHMNQRLYFIQTMFCMSLYNWYSYSLFDTINNGFLMPYSQNCILMLVYLGWDTYHMITKPTLFRTDLMIHHLLALSTYIIFTPICSLQMSHLLTMECISLMNSIWRNNPRLLKIYRTVCILFVRIPLWSWTWIYYFPTYVLPHYRLSLSHNLSVYFSIVGKIMLFINLYDLLLLWKLYKPSKMKH